MRSGQRRSPVYIITGLIIGLIAGLLLSWTLSPTEPIDTEPNSLRSDFKDTYRSLIASAYLANSDLGRADARLALLGDENSVRALTVQAQRMLGEEGSELSARALGILAADLQKQAIATPTKSVTSTPVPVETQVEIQAATQYTSPTLTTIVSLIYTSTVTITPLASSTPIATVGAAFELSGHSLVCHETYKETSLIMVNIFDSANQPVPGKEVIASWDQGQDSFYTGLKIEFGLGYADFEMLPDVEYTISIADGGESLTGLKAIDCENDDGDRWLSSWQIIFIQP